MKVKKITKIIALAVLFCANFVSTRADAVVNTKGWLDTATISAVLAEDTLRRTAAFSLTDGEDIALLLKVDDTTSAGFASDSVQFFYWYESGFVTEDSAGNRDTAWMAESPIVIDTMSSDSFGVSVNGYCTASGYTYPNWDNRADTTYLTGYATQIRQILPFWGDLIRFGATGMADNCGSALVIVFEVRRRAFLTTGD